MNWDDLQKYVDTTGVDRDAFERGESVIVQIVTDRPEGTVLQQKGYMLDGYDYKPITFDYFVADPVSTIPAEGTEISISIDYQHFSDYVDSDLLNVYLDESCLNCPGLVTVSANAGSVQLLAGDDTLAARLEYDRSGKYTIENSCYFVICSLPLLQCIVDQIPEGTQWWIEGERFLRGKQEVGYNQAFLYTNGNAGNLGVDTAVTKVISQIQYIKNLGDAVVQSQYFKLNNERETNDANAQIYQQSLIMTIISGVCIALVVLMILVSTLRLETQSEKKRYGILQAIGMSKRQRTMELIRRSAVRSLVAVAAAVACYLGWLLIRSASSLAAGESPAAVIGALLTTLATCGLTTPRLFLLLATAFLATFAICFGAKRGLNKCNLMELLHEEE